LLEFAPLFKQPVTAEDGSEFFGIEEALLNEPRNAVVILRASDLEADGGEMVSALRRKARRSPEEQALAALNDLGLGMIGHPRWLRRNPSPGRLVQALLGRRGTERSPKPCGGRI